MSNKGNGFIMSTFPSMSDAITVQRQRSREFRVLRRTKYNTTIAEGITVLEDVVA